jgi:hypothetical protein
MDLAEVEAVFDEAIKGLAVEPVRTVTVQLTNAELDSIGLALGIAYDDQASYIQTARNAILRPRGLSLGNFGLSLERQAVLDCTVRKGCGNRSLATGARLPSTCCWSIATCVARRSHRARVESVTIAKGKTHDPRADY